MGRVFPQDGLLYCNLYRDSVLVRKAYTEDGTAPADSPGKTVSLAAYDPAVSELKGVSIPREESGWEAVSIVPASEETWYFTWKKAAPEKIDFRYTRFDIPSWTEEEIDEERYLAMLRPTPGEKAPHGLVLIIEHLAEITGSPISGGHVYDVWLRRPFPYRAEQYRFGDDGVIDSGDAELHTLEAFAAGGEIFLLHDELLYRSQDGKIVLKRLPSLPDGFVYTRFAAGGEDFVLAAWEEQDFVLVGRAGLMFFPFGTHPEM